jgi:DNA polymerase III delta prime subunit
MWVEPTDLPRLAARHDFLLLVGDPSALLPHLASLKPRLFSKQDDKKSFSVAEMREIIAQNVAQHLSRQYFVLSEADTLTEGAQSAALKLLEEPHVGAAFIWLTARPAVLLSTVKSRAQLFRVRLPQTPPPANLTAAATQLLFGAQLDRLRVIKQYEKDRAAAERLLFECARQLEARLPDFCDAVPAKLLAASAALSQNVYPRLALLKMI